MAAMPSLKNNLWDLMRSLAPSNDRCFAKLNDGRTVSYADVEKAAARYANALVGLGVRPGDRVAVQVEKTIEAILLYLGCLRAGAIFLPLNAAYTNAEIEYFLGDAAPRLFICDPNQHEAYRAAVGENQGRVILTLDENGEGSLVDLARTVSDTFDDAPMGTDDLAAILYTSGTTGRSKGAMLSHGNLASNALTLVDVWRFASDDVLIHALPIFHSHGLFVATNVVLLSGASMIFHHKFDPKQILAALPHATTMMGVPTFYTRLLGEPGLTRQTTAHMRLFISGSAPLLAETHHEWRARTGHAILERYGLTETNMNTSNPYDGERIPGTVGPPLPGVELRIADLETGENLGVGQIGMIEVRGPNVFKGYWRMPDKTASEFKTDGYFITGDLGKIDEKGYVYIVGRGKDLIITGGFNVYPKEVETEIDAIPGVVESAVIGIPHNDFGEGVTAIVVRSDDAELSEKDIMQALALRLAKFKLPKRVVFVAALPRNTMGKVQKNVLRNSYREIYASR